MHITNTNTEIENELDLQSRFFLKKNIIVILKPEKTFLRNQNFFMAYWLVKSEPSTYSWDQLVKDGETCWSGVRNYAARLHLRNMKKGEQVFFYHSNEGTDIVGISKVSKEHYQDPTTDDDRWVAADLKPFKKLKKPVTLDQIKKDKRLKNMALVRIGRLSVQPVSEEEWNVILELSGDK
jgi:predicted RNA-binding protein with PUA-like domain